MLLMHGTAWLAIMIHCVLKTDAPPPQIKRGEIRTKRK